MEHGYRQQLNDFVQRKYGGTKEVKWEDSKSGPEHRPSWEFRAICELHFFVSVGTLRDTCLAHVVDGYEIGHGQGISKGAAKEAAAARALEYLRSREE